MGRMHLSCRQSLPVGRMVLPTEDDVRRRSLRHHLQWLRRHYSVRQLCGGPEVQCEQLRAHQFSLQAKLPRPLHELPRLGGSEVELPDHLQSLRRTMLIGYSAGGYERFMAVCGASRASTNTTPSNSGTRVAYGRRERWNARFSRWLGAAAEFSAHRSQRRLRTMLGLKLNPLSIVTG